MIRVSSLLLSLTVLSCFMDRAGAETITISFQGIGPDVGSKSYSDTSLTGSPSILATANVPGVGGDFLRQTAAGLGVGHDLDLLAGPNQIDNSGFTEAIDLKLESAGSYTNFTLTSITFGQVDDFNFTGVLAFLNEVLGDDDIQILTPGNTPLDPNGNGEFTYTFTTPVSLNVGDIITVKAPGSGFQAGNDDFTLVSLQLDATSVVPEPVSVISWLAIGGVGALVAHRRRKLAAQR